MYRLNPQDAPPEIVYVDRIDRANPRNPIPEIGTRAYFDHNLRYCRAAKGSTCAWNHLPSMEDRSAAQPCGRRVSSLPAAVPRTLSWLVVVQSFLIQRDYDGLISCLLSSCRPDFDLPAVIKAAIRFPAIQDLPFCLTRRRNFENSSNRPADMTKNMINTSTQRDKSLPYTEKVLQTLLAVHHIAHRLFRR